MNSEYKDRAVSDSDLIERLKKNDFMASISQGIAAHRIEELLAHAESDQELMLKQAEQIAKLKKDLHNMRVGNDKLKRENNNLRQSYE